MPSITQGIIQPKGGYLSRSAFEEIAFYDNKHVDEKYNIPPTLVGLAVDYLTRFMTGTPKKDAFRTSLQGALKVGIEEYNYALELLDRITCVDDISVIWACRLVGYDTYYRDNKAVDKGRCTVRYIQPDASTVRNVRVFLERSLVFWERFGPIVKSGFDFNKVFESNWKPGDGDFLTEDTIWDFKVYNREITSRETLQVLIYYIMGIDSGKREFRSIRKLGIYNPKLNKAYLASVYSVKPEHIEELRQQLKLKGMQNREWLKHEKIY